MYCTNCGKFLENSYKYCTSCGEKVTYKIERTMNLPLKYVKGKTGENKVRFELYKLSEDYLVLHDCLFENNGKTMQIDHLVVSKYGIFVIETKHYDNCLIIGKKSDKKWTYILGKEKYKIDNPIYQNDAHVKFLKNLLKLKEDIFIPIVCICGTCKLDVEYGKVVPIIYLIEKIEYFKEERLPNYKEIYYKLMVYNLTNKEERKKHVEIAKEMKEIFKNRCPNCGNLLIIKEGKNGGFIGCSNFPRCKYTENMK